MIPCRIVDGGGVRILIDTGPDYLEAWDAIQAELAGRAPDLVISTHGHLDHAGLGRRWQASGVPVMMHESDTSLVTTPQLQAPADFAAISKYAESSGAPAAVMKGALKELEERRRWALAAATDDSYSPAGRNGRWPTGLRFQTFEPRFTTTDETDLLAVAGLKAHHTPGHTPGNIVVECLSEGWLFSGDQLLPDMTPTPAVQFTGLGAGRDRFHSLPAFVESMEQIDAAALGECFPGHGEPFRDVHASIRGTLDTIQERTRRAVQALRDLGAATVFELCEAIYPRAARRRFWQVVATIQGNLDIAEATGTITLEGGRYELMPRQPSGR